MGKRIEEEENIIWLTTLRLSREGQHQPQGLKDRSNCGIRQ